MTNSNQRGLYGAQHFALFANRRRVRSDEEEDFEGL
jgi:hypothetical protein